MRWFLILLAVAASRVVTATAADPAKPVDFSREIKPILSDRCYACHGPDASKRKAKLRLDTRDDALKLAIVPGKADASPLIARITTTDPHAQMPPPESKKPRLTPEQVATFKRWINDGAKFDEHWAYTKPVKPAVPAVDGVRSPHPIDAFVRFGLKAAGISPVAEADRVTLIRRLSFDLTGLPPTAADVDAFVNDRSPDAYAKLVDRLLASPHLGERMAIFWLDLVRYADTGGYHSDNHRDIWMYRDWVIDAFNRNMPFDQFTRDQLAGDLIPNATREQRIASGYNRMLMTTEEGGAQPKEYAAKYAADRVRNVSATWLGSTMGCCECHDHKFDPFTMKDFYSLASFFADVQEKAVGRQDQTPFPTREQETRLKALDAKIANLKAELSKPSKELDDEQGRWEQSLKNQKDAAKKLPKEVTAALAVDPVKRNDKQKLAIMAYFRQSVSKAAESQRQALTATQKERDALAASIPTTLVSMSGTPRTMRVLPRGNWLDDTGEIVAPNAPAFLPAIPQNSKGRNSRLDLADWMVAADNPLTSRVFVNRVWKLMFGLGLVRSMEDFGAQGQPPTHPELLDWLAVSFREGGWNVKDLIRQIVTSATYKQASVVSKELRERDPANLLLARQNRYRLDAEIVRDNALAVSGLLSRRMGGPSVKPYQPAGYWSFLNFPKRDWYADKGENQYRRGLYTYWCRTFPHPSLVAFDAPSREECVAERARSNTPLQALVLLNDPTYVEAARAFAVRIVTEGGETDEARIAFAFRAALSRPPRTDEMRLLTDLAGKHRAEYRADKTAAEKVLNAGQAAPPKDKDVAELAAWTSVARVILNLHEMITRS
jgi:mono/diheme cytochrome c family protein